MRLFIAINFNNATRAQLIFMRDELRSRSIRGNFTLNENLHLTLAFLGDCDNKRLMSAKQAMNSVESEPFIITIAGGGYLDKGRPNLVFCDIKNDGGRNELCRLQAILYENFFVKGFELDTRKFKPHITLGREVVWKDTGDFSGFVDFSFPVIEETVRSIELMKSERINGKLTYTAIYGKML